MLLFERRFISHPGSSTWMIKSIHGHIAVHFGEETPEVGMAGVGTLQRLLAVTEEAAWMGGKTSLK